MSTAELAESEGLPVVTPVFLDWNSTSPPHPDVVAAMGRAASYSWANPASVHALGRHAKHLVENVRDQAAARIGANARDLVFTSGGTEANNWALSDAPGLVLTRLEHPSVAKVAERLAVLGRPVTWLPVDRDGIISPAQVRQALANMPRGTVVAAMAVNHETGIIQPVNAIADVAHEFGAFVHVDAVQAFGKLALDSWNGWDSLTLAAHKVRGPKGVGLLAWRHPRPIPSPLLFGGGQERGLRPGTVDPLNIAGFGAAIERLEVYQQGQLRLAGFRDRLELELQPLAQSNVAAGAPRLAHVSSLFVPGWPAEELVAAMDLEGVCISAGSACAAGTAEVSPVIEAIHGTARARASVRVSLGELTTPEDVDAGVAAFRRVLARS